VRERERERERERDFCKTTITIPKKLFEGLDKNDKRKNVAVKNIKHWHKIKMIFEMNFLLL